jgi:hypothetical protein
VNQEPLYLGLKLYELLTLTGIVFGPIVAVLITLWVDNRRRDRDQKLLVLRMLITTRHLPADPAYQVAINLIPVEFNNKRAVMDAHKEFVEAVAVQLDGKNDPVIRQNWETKSTRLVYAVARSLKFDLRETDLQTKGYASGGWTQREDLLMDSQRAMRDVATNLLLQSRLLANAKLTPAERQFLGMEGDEN